MDEYYTQFCQDYRKFIKEKSFILDNKSDTLIPFDAYISSFFKEKGVMDFFLYVPHTPYTTSVLDQFKDKFVYTSFLMNADGSKSLNSLVQLSKDTHLIINYPYREKQFFCEFLVYTKKVQDYLDFLDKNEQFEYKKTKNVGFGT